jgi:hypothetical protein
VNKLLGVIIMLHGLHAVAESDLPEGSMDDYVTCAVYYRMIAGSMSSRYGSGQDELATIPKENMALMMELARSSATEEFGEEFGEELFQDQWRAIFTEMTDQINRNYDNIAKLKYRYDKRCRRLGGKSPVIGAPVPK